MDRKLSLTLMLCALGYFVDVYDIIIFTAVRVPSLQALGLSGDALTMVGLRLMNIQLVGMFLGGVLWGILGDKRGRLSILLGSILLYSTANIINAFVTTVEQYAVLRFIAGVGLAGELGAAVALVSELMQKDMRGWGATLIVTSGVLGGITGGLAGNYLSWQNAYLVGGVGGFILLFLRIGLKESTLFNELKAQTNVKRGHLQLLLRSPDFLKRYVKCIFVGLPIWIFIGLFMILSPEIAKALEIQGEIKASLAILFFNIGLGLGDFSSGLLSQFFKRRKQVALVYLGSTLISAFALLSLHGASTALYYKLCVLLGMSAGYWTLFNILAAEQFGTNMRATTAVTLPNFVRLLIVPLASVLMFIKPQFGIINSLGILAALAILIAIYSVFTLEESFGKNLKFVEG